jgi:hypothetical protein
MKMTEEDALSEQERTWLIIALKLAGDKVKVDLKDLPEVAVEERTLSVLVTAKTDTLDLALRQHLLMVCPQH